MKRRIFTIIAVALMLLSLIFSMTACDGGSTDDPIKGGGEHIQGGGYVEPENTEPFRFDETDGGYMLVEFFPENYSGKDVVIPSTYKGKPVIGINGPVFENADITSLVIPDTVKFLPSTLLAGCTTIQSLTLPACEPVSVSDDFSIGQTFFDGEAPASLKVVTITSGEKIGDRKFHDCKYIEKIVVKGDVKEIGYAAFAGCTSLTEIVIEEGVKTIKGDVFDGCTALESVELPKGVTLEEGGLFRGCTALKSFVIPDNMTVIPTYFFEDCTSLKTVIIGSSVTKISASAFYGCTALESVYFCGSSRDWSNVIVEEWMNNSFFDAEVYFYSEEGDIFEYISGNVSWHYGEDGQPEFWSFQLDNTLDGKSFAYTGSSVSITDEYWSMILYTKEMGMVEEVYGDDPTHMEIINNSTTKEEYEAGLLTIYSKAGDGISVSFAEGKATLSEGGESATPLEYIEYEGAVYYTLTESLAFYVGADGGIYEEISTEYFTVKHYYIQQ